MKKILLACSIMLMASFVSDNRLSDGMYKGASQSYYSNEPYYGCTKIIINEGKITGVDFSIRDSAKHEDFDDRYERYFEGNDLYVQQCRNDRKGVKSYPDSLMKYQDLEKVDVISGATWSYNMFKASAKIALDKAAKK